MYRLHILLQTVLQKLLVVFILIHYCSIFMNSEVHSEKVKGYINRKYSCTCICCELLTITVHHMAPPQSARNGYNLVAMRQHCFLTT